MQDHHFVMQMLPKTLPHRRYEFSVQLAQHDVADYGGAAVDLLWPIEAGWWSRPTGRRCRYNGAAWLSGHPRQGKFAVAIGLPCRENSRCTAANPKYRSDRSLAAAESEVQGGSYAVWDNKRERGTRCAANANWNRMPAIA